MQDGVPAVDDIIKAITGVRSHDVSYLKCHLQWPRIGMTASMTRGREVGILLEANELWSDKDFKECTGRGMTHVESVGS